MQSLYLTVSWINYIVKEGKAMHKGDKQPWWITYYVDNSWGVFIYCRILAMHVLVN